MEINNEINCSDLVEITRQEFEKEYGQKASGVAIAPGRINIIGEHTDYTGGLAIPAAINRWTSVAFARRNDKKIFIKSINFNDKFDFDLGDKLKSNVLDSNWKKYAYGTWSLFDKKFLISNGINILINGNIPIGKGISSSAAFEVSMLNALRAAYMVRMDDDELVLLAQKVEHEYLGVHSGLLDQYASQFSSMGHFQIVDFLTNEREYIRGSKKFNEWCWILVDSLVHREIATSEYEKRVEQCEQALSVVSLKNSEVRIYREISRDDIENYLIPEDETLANRMTHFLDENKRTLMARDFLSTGNADFLGQTLIEGHESLRDLYEVSCKELDYIQEIGIDFDGCVGGRMMGGGFGGGVLFLVKKSKKDEFNEYITKKYEEYSGKKTYPFVFQLVGGAKVFF